MKNININDICQPHTKGQKSFNKEKSKCIYHFTKKEIVIEHILPDEKLLLNSILNTNDPREKKQYPLIFDIPMGIAQQQTCKEFSQLIRTNVKTICFSQDYHIAERWWRGYDLPRMWAQYGENHFGICLEIDRDLFLDENKNNLTDYYFKSVRYEVVEGHPYISYNKFIKQGLQSYVSEFRKDYIEYLFFTKHIDWEAEREIRLISINNDIEFMSIKKSISRIILGIDFNLSYLPSLISVAKSIPVEILHYSKGHLGTRKFKSEFVKEIMKY